MMNFEYPGFAFFSLWIILPVVTHLAVLGEERFLESKYGSEYLDYRTSAPRYAGLISRLTAGNNN